MGFRIDAAAHHNSISVRSLPLGLLIAALALPGTAQAGPGDTVLISKSATTGQAVRSSAGVISNDARHVVFQSDGSVAPGGHGWAIYGLDRVLHTTQWLADGGNPTDVTGDGRYVAYGRTDSSTFRPNVWLLDRDTGNSVRIAEGEGGQVSAGGRFIAFHSSASNLVAGDTNGVSDVFVRDRQLGITTRVSIGPSGRQGNEQSFLARISADGRYVAFYSVASNLVSGDTNGVGDIFVHDRSTHLTTRVSVGTGGVQGNGRAVSLALSGDGRYVAFGSQATNLVAGDTNAREDAFVHDRVTGLTERISVNAGGTQGDGDSYPVDISGDGRYVALLSGASNLVTNDTNDGGMDVFVRDRDARTLQRASVSSEGQPDTGESYTASIADNGTVVFLTRAALVASDRNADANFEDVDLYLHELDAAAVPRTVAAFDQGWYNIDGRHNPDNTNTITGECCEGGGQETILRDWFAFDLATVSGPIDSAELVLEQLAMGRDATTETFELWDFGGSVETLVAGTGGIPYFEDLGSGKRYASTTLAKPADVGSTRRIRLNEAALADLNRAVGRKFALGGWLATIDNGNEDWVRWDGRITLVLNGASATDAQFTVKPATLDFGPIGVGTALTRSFWLRNKGATALPIERISLRGVDATEFSLRHGCGKSVPAGASCPIRITFSPVEAGTKSARLRVEAGGSLRLNQIIGEAVR